MFKKPDTFKYYMVIHNSLVRDYYRTNLECRPFDNSTYLCWCKYDNWHTLNRIAIDEALTNGGKYRSVKFDIDFFESEEEFYADMLMREVK